MILKFRSKRLGCWVTEDCIRRTMSYECRFVPAVEASDAKASQTETIVEADKEQRVVPVRCILEDTANPHAKKEVRGAPIDWDWIVDTAVVSGDTPCPPEYKAIVVEYRKGAGWESSERTFIFSTKTSVFLCNDEGKTIERL